MNVALQLARKVRIPVVLDLAIAASRKTDLDVKVSIAPRADLPDWRPILINGQPPQKQQTAGRTEGMFVEEYLPEGTCWLEVTLYESNGGPSPGESLGVLVVPQGAGPLELPPLKLEPPAFDKMAGQAAPEIDAIDLNS